MNKLNKIFRIVALVIVLLALCGSTTRAYTIQSYQQEMDVAQSQPAGPVNEITLNVTYDTATDSYSIAGFSYAQLKYLGMPGLEQLVSYTVDNLQYVTEQLQQWTGFEFVTDKPGLEKLSWGFLDAFDTFSFTMNNAEICLNVEGIKAICIPWNQVDRANLFSAINSNFDTQRIEDWLSIVNIAIVVDNTARVSNPLVVNLATLLKVDVSKEGGVSVEGYYTGIVQPQIYDASQQVGINTATICWSKGNIYTTVNGKSLPQIVIYQPGVDVIDKALNLQIGNTDPFFASQLGASVSFNGVVHEITQCTK
jgi:hypothetical protein